MKLEPVYVVAQQRTQPSMPTRRAFLLAGATFTLGAAAGGACGYSLGAAGGQPESARPGEEELPPSGDRELDELRRLAVRAPLAELIEKRLDFTFQTLRYYARDPVLWRGVGRLCDATLGEEPVPNRRVFAKALVQMIEKADPEMTRDLIGRVPALRQVK
jgi:hypothetical protein